MQKEKKNFYFAKNQKKRLSKKKMYLSYLEETKQKT